MNRPHSAKAMTLTSKILYRHAIAPQKSWVESGDVLRLRVDWTIASELAWNGMNSTYEKLGRPSLYNPDRFYLAIDHTVDPETLATDKRTQALVELSRNFAKERHLRHFYDANQTIMHTTFYRDLVCPGDVVLGADSHTSSHGGMGAFAIGLGGADVTVAMVLGETWIEVPEAIAVDYRGTIPFGLAGKDVVLKTLGDLGRNTVALERTVEFVGDAARRFTSDMRFTICNMTAEFGGLNGIFEADDIIAAQLHRRRSHRQGSFFRADEQAPYVARYPIDLDRLAPQVAKPFSPDNVFAIDAVLGQPLDGVFIGACTTTEEELIVAGLLFEAMLKAGKQPKPCDASRRIVVPGNLEIMETLRNSGLLSAYEQCGFRVRPPGCSMCLGVASDRAGDGEQWLSSQNRNFPNRMGKGSLAWLASATTVAASALEMKLSDPRPWLNQLDRDRVQRLLNTSAKTMPEVATPITEPSVDEIASPSIAKPISATAPSTKTISVRGRVQRFGDHIDTDAIIPGEFCHLTDWKALGKVCFHHVRPEFHQRAQQGATIVVAGHGWGSGSSREQAVWALRGAGIVLVIARSFAFIHKRNLVNEALPYLVIDDDAFYERVSEDDALDVDLSTGTVIHISSGTRFSASPSSAVVRALAAEGGIIPAILKHGSATFAALQSAR